MLKYPDWISPDIFSIGPITIRWYGLMYVLGFVLAYLIINSEVKRKKLNFTDEDISDYIFYLMLGVILGGRIGYIVFYNLSYYLQNPMKIIAITEGGMSFHGGLIGVMVAVLAYSIRKKKTFADLGDMAALGAPLGLGFGRIGNFINGELYGRPSDPNFALSFIFPKDPLQVPRHASQLYESFFEGFLMFGIIYFLSRKTQKPGILFSTFMMLYGIFRFFIEYTREPDAHIGLMMGLSRGQMLCLPMFIVGLILLVYVNKQKTVEKIEEVN